MVLQMKSTVNLFYYSVALKQAQKHFKQMSFEWDIKIIKRIYFWVWAKNECLLLFLYLTQKLICFKCSWTFFKANKGQNKWWTVPCDTCRSDLQVLATFQVHTWICWWPVGKYDLDCRCVTCRYFLAGNLFIPADHPHLWHALQPFTTIYSLFTIHVLIYNH